MSNDLELRHLRYFRKLAVELHFGKAAEQLFLTQPALSRQIKQLEEILGVSLFQRTKRTVSLTKAGEYLLTETSQIFDNIEFIKDNLRHIQNGDQGELRIGFVGSAMQSVIPGLLKEINTQSPGIHSVLTELPNQQQIDMLKNDQLDLGFIRTIRLPAGIQKLDVIEENFCLILPSDHPLDQHSFNSVADLRDESFILFSSQYSHGYFDKIMSIFEDAGFTPRVAHESVHASTIFRLVEHGLGIGIVPSSLKHGFSLPIKFIELNNIPQRTTLSAVWKTDHRNPLVHRVTPILQELAKN
ncbi:MAG: LysR family transcriptional regulator [Balneolaceae bacterium]|nr:LysR family transcriptional regulator [Balneolaceae bacterium]